MNEKLRITNVKMIASTLTVTIRGSQVLPIGVIASLVALMAVEVVGVTAAVASNLSKIKMPTPRIIPTITKESTSVYKVPISILSLSLVKLAKSNQKKV